MDQFATTDREDADKDPWALPTAWCWAELSQLGSWTSGGTPKSTEPGYYDGAIPWFRISDLNEGRLLRAERSITEAGLNASSAKIVPSPFLMFAMYGASIGKMGISEVDASTNQAIACCQPYPAAGIDFMFWGLQRLKRSIIELGQGGAQPNISQKILLEQKLPLAPVAEQGRIVARIAALFSEIADGEIALEHTRKGLDVFRRSLLKAAVTGELTRDWRERNSCTETGDQIIERLRTQAPRPRKLDGWKPSARFRLPELPQSWAWCAIAEAGDVQLGRQRAPQHHDGDHMRPYLRVANVLDDHLNLDDVKEMNFTPVEFETFALRSGDILSHPLIFRHRRTQRPTNCLD